MQFKFRLETMLSVHQAERDRLRIALAEVQGQAEHARRRADGIDAELREAKQAQVTRPGTVDVERLQAGQQYAAALRRDQECCARERAAIADEIVVRREALLAADRQLRTLEKLREKQHGRFRAEEQRRDGRQMDELANRSAAPQFDA